MLDTTPQLGQMPTPLAFEGVYLFKFKIFLIHPLEPSPFRAGRRSARGDVFGYNHKSVLNKF
jgi:hypothetical protein